VYEFVFRNLFGAAVDITPGSITPAVNSFSDIGDGRFSRPGAPRTGVALLPTGVSGVVDITTKSDMLSSVS